MTPEGPGPAAPLAPSFRERLSIPVRWWLIALLFVISVFVAIAFYLGPLNATVITAVAAGVVLAVLVPYGGVRVEVDDRALTVGPHRIEWAWVGGARALDAAAAKHRMGPGADARAHLVIRPYIPEAVEVTIADAADPHPYWLVNSRRAEELAAAINARVDRPVNPAEAPQEHSDADT